MLNQKPILRKNNTRIFYLIILIILFLQLISCSDNKTEESYVISVGSEKVTKNDFQTQFNLHPQYRPNTIYKNALLQQADKLAERLYYFKAAQAVKCDTLNHIQQQSQYIINSELLKELYRANVLNLIHVSEEDAWEEYKKENIAVSVRHLFSEDKNKINSIRHELLEGNDFFHLASQLFNDSLLSANGGYLGYVRLIDFDPMLVDSIYNLQIGEISNPLISTHGYHIFKIEDIQQSLFLDKEYFNSNIDEFKKKVSNRRAAKESSLFVKKY